MTIHFVREMEHLHRDILSMCSAVEELINDAVEGLKHGRTLGISNLIPFQLILNPIRDWNATTGIKRQIDTRSN